MKQTLANVYLSICLLKCRTARTVNGSPGRGMGKEESAGRSRMYSFIHSFHSQAFIYSPSSPPSSSNLLYAILCYSSIHLPIKLNHLYLPTYLPPKPPFQPPIFQTTWKGKEGGYAREFHGPRGYHHLSRYLLTAYYFAG